MSKDYTTGNSGMPARPSTHGGLWHDWHRTESLPYILGNARVREIAREIADGIISDARTQPGPVVWITGNSYMPPLRSIAQAEYVYNAENNDDGELFAFLVELIEDHLSAANVAMESPEYDNALYVVDLKRWQYRDDDDVHDGTAEYDDLNDEWEPVDILAVDDNAENPRE
ncbi:MAG TPA: hypothetical protein VFE08_14510 [Candidatus Sulfotelmatobacter sp.]|jgi:hypothetical protein|nr:hypothetical protein [Candidatus Sulfotelmatobacter sp.]